MQQDDSIAGAEVDEEFAKSERELADAIERQAEQAGAPADEIADMKAALDAQLNEARALTAQLRAQAEEAAERQASRSETGKQLLESAEDLEDGTGLDLTGFTLDELEAMLNYAATQDADVQMQVAARIEEIRNPAVLRKQSLPKAKVGARAGEMPTALLDGTGGWSEYRRVGAPLMAVYLGRPFEISDGPAKGEYDGDHMLCVDADGWYYAIPRSTFDKTWVPERPL